MAGRSMDMFPVIVQQIVLSLFVVMAGCIVVIALHNVRNVSVATNTNNVMMETMSMVMDAVQIVNMRTISSM